ncbi:MAG: zinc-ribbon domain-containing protein [Candidatus Lokiarchaeota archaeon]|nr:zinc-ribbon domain-containing protein [Candidatus Lokiarchaeota archaeon]
MNFCINCGEKLADEMDFCSKCGHKQPDLEEIRPQISLLQTPKQVEATMKKTNYSKDNITDAIGCFIIITGFIVLIILFVFFKEWLAILWPYIIGIILISWIIRLLWAGIVELFQRRKKK